MNLGPLIPVKLGSKSPPFLKEWQNASPEDLAQACERYEGSNRGLRLDNFLALDPDDQAASDFLEGLEKEEKLPPTITWTTWRNRTVRLYRKRKGLSPVKPPAGSPMMLEIRTGAGMYVIIPPSKVNGRPYQFHPHLSPQDIEPADLPEETLKRILQALHRPQAHQRVARPSSCPWTTLWPGVPEGSRDDTAARLAGRLLSRGLPPDEVVEILTNWDARNEPPLGPRDLLKVVSSIYRKENLKESKEPTLIVPASSLLTRKYSEQDEVIGNGIQPAGSGMLIAGESGVGKSLYRTELAIHLAMGWDFHGLVIPKPRRVLIVQFENTERTEQYRLKRMLIGLEIDNFPDVLSFSSPTQRFDLKNKKDWQAALELVTESNAEVIIWDPLTSLHSVNENDNVQIRRVLDSITQINRRTGTTSTVIHHFGKPQEGLTDAYRTRGASSIRDWADTLITLTRKPHEEKKLLNVGFAKVRNGPEPKTVLLERDTSYFIHYVTEEDVLCPPSKVKAILLALGGRVEEQKKLIEAIIERIKCSERSAKTYINLAVEKGAINAAPNPKNKRLKIYEIGD